MKIFFILFTFMLFSCTKENKNGSEDEITYELKTTSGSFSFIQYLDETASQTQTSSSNLTWSIKFKNTAGRPRQLILQAVGDGQATLTGNIYVNGILVKSGTGTQAVMLSSNIN